MICDISDFTEILHAFYILNGKKSVILVSSLVLIDMVVIYCMYKEKSNVLIFLNSELESQIEPSKVS